jgi:hypothetical protein
MPSSLRDRYDQKILPSGDKIDHTLGNAFIGLGRIIEYFAAEMKKRCAPKLQVPIELSAISRFRRLFSDSLAGNERAASEGGRVGLPGVLGKVVSVLVN